MEQVQQPQQQENTTQFDNFAETLQGLFNEDNFETLNYAECVICCQMKFQYAVSNDCQHTYCQECLKQYIFEQMKRLAGEELLLCPHEGCGKSVSTHTLNQLFTKFFSDQKAQPILLYCAMCKEINLYERSALGVLQCKRCRATYDANTRAVTERCQKEIDQVKLLRSAGLIECPRCLVWVQKIEGCDHITCVCSYNFCYKCGSFRPSHSGHTCQNHDYGVFGGHLSKL